MAIRDSLVLILHGAYGRSYNTWEDCENDWKDGKDFKIMGGPYCSVRDVDTMRQDGVRALYFITGSSVVLGKIVLIDSVNGSA